MNKYFNYDNENIFFPANSNTTIGDQEQLFLLEELSNNGFIQKKQETYHLDYIEACNLDPFDRQILNLPDLYPYELYLRNIDGNLSDDSCRLKIQFQDTCDETGAGNLFNFERTGGIVVIDDKDEFLLSQNQIQFLDAIDNFNKNTSGKHERFVQFSRLKKYADAACCTLHPYLQDLEIIAPDKINIDGRYNPENEELNIVPQIKGVDSDNFLKKYQRASYVKSQYHYTNDKGNKVRVLINNQKNDEGDSLKTELEKLKSYSSIKGKQKIQEFIETDLTGLDSDFIDIEEFYSKRVIELGLYKPVYTPFISSEKNEWIPGLEINDRIEGTSRIKLEDKEELDTLINLFEEAKKKNKDEIDFKGATIPVEVAENLINISKKQLSNPQEPAYNKDETTEKKVLIIKENTLETEYEEEGIRIHPKYFSFEDIPNLAPGIHLKKHQKEGVAWLQTMKSDKHNSPGVLLADDMGLGKTLQVLYLIEWYIRKYGSDKPFLIVAPVSLLENWQEEYKKFFNPLSLEIMLLYGKKLKDYIIPNDLRATKKMLQQSGIALTSYETIRKKQMIMCAIDWSVVILDEAQKVKTPGTLVTNSIKALKSDYKVAMTGTPVENSLMDLWCIMDFAVPGLLGNAKEFNKKYLKPLNANDSDISQLGDELRKEIGLYLLRRLKTDVAKELPSKNIICEELEMPKCQKQIYDHEIQKLQDLKEQGLSTQGKTLETIAKLRIISDHPMGISNSYHDLNGNELLEQSAKLQLTMDWLRNIQQKEEKVILFTDRKEIQRLLQKVISESFSFKPHIINGSTPVTTKGKNREKLSRQATINEFEAQDGFSIIIMSPLAAGFGLNVTAANHVIHYTRHWNPAKESQATDRAYRIGQTKDVNVYYPFSIHPDYKSFDIILDELLKRKSALANETLFPSESLDIKNTDFINEFNVTVS